MNTSITSSMRSKGLLFESQNFTYEEQLQSIRKMYDSEISNIPISLDQSTTEADMKSSRRAQRLIEATYNDQSTRKAFAIQNSST